MWPYWLLFAVAAWMALRSMNVPAQVAQRGNRWPGAWIGCFFVLTIAIGLRQEVGGDWVAYQELLDKTVGYQLEDVLLSLHEPAYDLLNWFGANVWGDVYFVNLVFGLFFTWGLIVFCRMQPRPWLAFLIAVPYLVTVVAMGYGRQAVAIGFVMLGVSALMRGSVFRFIVWVAVAMTFHRSAIILVPLAIFSRENNRLLTQLGVLFSLALLFALMVLESVDRLVAGYITAEYESSGAAIRVAMNALPAALFLLYRKRFFLDELQERFWKWVSIGGLLFVILLLASPSSTAVDRLALYWIPLQLFVWSRLPDAMGHSPAKVRLWAYVVFAYCFAVHFVWLFFANHSTFWIPYRFYPWEWLWS